MTATDLRTVHEDHGATMDTVGGRAVPEDYGRPERTHRAVRNGVGVTEMPYGVLVVEGSDRVGYVDNVVSNRVPAPDEGGCYAVICSPQGRVEVDLYIYSGADRVLILTPPGRARALADGWEVFIEDVEITVASDRFVVFGVHGPSATEKLASVLSGAQPPEAPLTFVRGSLEDHGVTVARTDAPTGEEGFEVVCSRDAAPAVFETLLTRGLNAVPFGRRTWLSLTLEAGTPLFESELEGRIPNVLGLRNALDFDKGCYVGQEVVSRIENRGHPNERLVGMVPEAVPQAGASVLAGDRTVGEVTRATRSPIREEPIALAVVDYDLPDDEPLTIRVDGEPVPATTTPLPFVEGSERSARIPTYG